MKISLYNLGDAKMFTVENDALSSPESRFQRIFMHFKIFKWFVTINVVLLLIFCGYALWSFYQLESALQSREGYALKKYEKIGSSSGKANVAELNDRVVISDFNKWCSSILKSLKNLQQDKEDRENESYNLKFLLHTITSVVENFIDSRQNATKSQRSSVVVTNLTDFEIHILKEFTRLKALTNRSNFKSRIIRTTKNVKDESQCGLQFIFTAVETDDSGKPIKVIVEPAKNNEGMISIKNTVNDWSNNKSDVRECIFNIIYESK